MFKTVRIDRGPAGFGGPLVITPTEQRNKVVCVTGGGFHPVALKLAELTGCELVDGFKTGCPDDQIAVVVVDCGGTARCGVYPKKRIPTINVMPVGKSGPLAQYITEDIYVSDVKVENISLSDGSAPAPAPSAAPAQAARPAAATAPAEKGNFLARFGKAAGKVVGIFFQAGRNTIDITIKSILPFMAFVSMIIGIILESGIGNIIANFVSPYAGSLPGLLVISVICSLPILSPMLGPGAVIAQVVGVLLGVEIGAGHIPPSYALPALFAINPQVGCDFLPVGLSLAEAEPQTIEIGVPTILMTRLVTGPLSVVIAYFMGIGLF
ncbi:Glucitol/sorbitol-specific phosphotransferase enzyme IIB component [Propionispora sp. 2/2-37]|uniref:PTS glucitol/sorbitol transporter subunit IIB n=1 Tax=Propionispora sp. 2/2-37 TaxID=1677858 RepID=UPI0006BB6911|nr:PTS glucitol/sorbitol transporter subunit IIB [Propionispora sp. 2/2-37]CUH96443.1 Glucitol/sorbitol-specific phosphotransferase enzyme IIB component [Propionispora sp. 2/2-37]